MDLAKLDKAIRSSKEGDLSKGIVDDFTYGNKALEITKTGKD